VKILNVKIDNLSLSSVLEKIGQFFQSGQHQIATVNPEFIMAAQKDEEFKNILNKCDLSVADGFGLVLAARRRGEKLIQRITGVDLMKEICHLAADQNRSVFLLGAKKKGVVEQTARQLISEFPGLKVVGAERGFRHWHRHFSDEKLITIINRRQPEILFVAFGQVKQEKWIYYNLPKMPSVKLAMGVGGAFDYISGRVKRAPRFMRSLGLEWLYRLIRQPWRLPRIVTAVFKFGWRILKMKKSDEV